MNFRQARKHCQRLGKRGEDLACKLLKEKHYDILCRNYKVKSGEIDIVARNGGILVFVEVKTRRYNANLPLRPAAGLRTNQKRRIFRAATNYMRSIGNPEVIFRFDLIELILADWSIKEIRHWPEHFKSTDLRDPLFKKFDYT